MEAVVLKLCVWILLADLAAGSDTSCQDVDHAACISMSQQNPHMCEDAVLGRSVCPKICNNCPLTCYSCNATSYDVTSCNTITCSQHQKCMIQSTHGAAPFTLGCVADSVCSAITPGSSSMTCCGSDLCNVPVLPTAAPTAPLTTSIGVSTKPPTTTHLETKTTSTTSTITSNPSTTSQLPSTNSPSSTTSTPSKKTTLSTTTPTTTTTLKATISHQRECPDGWIQLDRSCFYFNLHDRVTHAMASERCLRDNAHLAFVDSDSKQHLISAHLHSYSEYNQGSNTAVWIGGERINYVWKWVNGMTKITTPFTYYFWSRNYPREPGSQGHSHNCAAMVGRVNGHWLDYWCSDELYYICERSVKISAPIHRPVTVSPTSKCPPHWKKHLNSCYFANLTNKNTRLYANHECARSNAHLAFIESEREQTFLADYIKNLPAYAHAKSENRTDMWIGGKLLNQTWYWKSSKHKEPMPYTHWYQHRSITTAGHVCATMVGLHKFKWEEPQCSTRHYYICEMELPQHVALIG